MNATNQQKAVFCDRDGTITEEVGYVNHLSRLRLIPGAAEGIRRLREAGWLVILATNQAGAARGYFPFEMIDQTHARLEELLAGEGTALDGIYYCPHHPDVGDAPLRKKCNCRKPRPGMLEAAAIEHGIDLTRSWVVGDKYSDVQLAHTVGGRGAFVLTGYGLGDREHFSHEWPREPDLIADDLQAAAARIIELGDER